MRMREMPKLTEKAREAGEAREGREMGLEEIVASSPTGCHHRRITFRDPPGILREDLPKFGFLTLIQPRNKLH